MLLNYPKYCCLARILLASGVSFQPNVIFFPALFSGYEWIHLHFITIFANTQKIYEQHSIHAGHRKNELVYLQIYDAVLIHRVFFYKHAFFHRAIMGQREKKQNMVFEYNKLTTSIYRLCSAEEPWLRWRFRIEMGTEENRLFWIQKANHFQQNSKNSE